MKPKKTMTKDNGNRKTFNGEREIEPLREILQKAVNREKAPDSLREKIRRLIRE